MRNIKFKEEKFYHVLNRGVDKRILFFDKEDFDRFRAYLYILNDTEMVRAANYFTTTRRDSIFDNARGDRLVAISGYCLMPTHFRLLLTPITENGVAKFMQRLQTAYTMYFNKKKARRGSLFEGTYKALDIDKDDELRYVIAYIHLNPAQFFDKDWEKISTLEEAQAVNEKVREYEYSSIGEYSSKNYKIVTPEHMPGHMRLAKNKQNHLTDWYKYKSLPSAQKHARL